MIISSRNKCQAEKLQSFILPEEDQFPFVLNGINLVHPESSDNHCEMLNVDSCYVIYPGFYFFLGKLIYRALCPHSYVCNKHNHHNYCNCHL